MNDPVVLPVMEGGLRKAGLGGLFNIQLLRPSLEDVAPLRRTTSRLYCLLQPTAPEEGGA